MASKKLPVDRRGFLKEASAGAVALAGLVPAAMAQPPQLAQGRRGPAAQAKTTGSYATTADKVRLYYEETGTGKPVIFVHEFAGDLRSWEPQMRHFGRRYRCIAFNARGYPPSDVPESLTTYSQTHAANDIKAVLDHLAIDRAHIAGLSMGGFATLHFGVSLTARPTMPKRLRSANTYNEPTVMWRLRHPIFGFAHATVIPSPTSATAVWYVNDVPERTHDFCDWSPAIAWLNAVCWELERNGWQLVERRV